MIRFVLRFIGLWLLAAGFIFVVYDGTKSIAANSLLLTKVQDVWSNVHQASLTALKPTLEKYSAALWDPGMTTLLDQPIALALGVLGALLLLLGRKKKPLIGYGR
jgi:hypothetical protein